MTPADGSTSRPSSLNRRDFFAAIVADARANLPPELARFRHRVNSMLLKLDYGNDRVHYEVWTDGARGRVEIGLHFEDGPASTMAYLAFFDQRIVEIKHLLGPQIELERWTTSWGHLFESEQLGRLDRRFAETVSPPPRGPDRDPATDGRGGGDPAGAARRHARRPRPLATACQEMRRAERACAGEVPKRTPRAARRPPSAIPFLVRKMREGIYRFMLVRPVL